MLEEDLENRTVLVKIGLRTSIRQIINYALSKIKQDWKVTLNAFQLDITKALQATEIIKTRLPFLHQENQFIQFHGTKEVKSKDSKGEEKVTERKINRSGISICLSRNQFQVTFEAGYQKPKPRVFM